MMMNTSSVMLITMMTTIKNIMNVELFKINHKKIYMSLNLNLQSLGVVMLN